MTRPTVHDVRPAVTGGLAGAPDAAATEALARLGLRLFAGREGYAVTEALAAQGYARHGAADLRRRYQANSAGIEAWCAGVAIERIVADVYRDERTLRATQARAAAGENPVPVALLALGAGVLLAIALKS